MREVGGVELYLKEVWGFYEELVGKYKILLNAVFGVLEMIG